MLLMSKRDETQAENLKSIEADDLCADVRACAIS